MVGYTEVNKNFSLSIPLFYFINYTNSKDCGAGHWTGRGLAHPHLRKGERDDFLYKLRIRVI